MSESLAPRKPTPRDPATDRGVFGPAITLAAVDAILDHHDVEGRLLGEGRASENAQRAANLAWTACPYRDGRDGLRMNVGALRQAAAHWGSVREAIAALAGERLRSRPARNLEHVLGLALRTATIPGYLIHSWPEGCRDRELSPVAAVLYKSMLGIATAATRLIERKILDGTYDPDAAVGAEEIIVFAEASSLLISSAGEVCAAPKAFIRDALEAILEPQPSDAASQLQVLVGDADGFSRYASLAAAFPVVILIAAALVEPLASEIAHTLATLDPTVGEALSLSDAVDGPMTLSVSIGSLTPEQFDEGFSLLMRILGDFDPEVADRMMAAIMGEETPSPESEDALAARLAERIEQALPPAALAPTAPEDFGRLLVRYYQFERRMLGVLHSVECGLNQALNRLPAESLPDASLIPNTLSDLHRKFLAERLGIAVAHQPGESILEIGVDRLSIAPARG
jgi:hypothetical protein